MPPAVAICRMCHGSGLSPSGKACPCRLADTEPEPTARDDAGRSFAARRARGRPLVTLSMAQSSRDRLRALAGERGLSLGDAVEVLLDAWDEREA